MTIEYLQFNSKLLGQAKSQQWWETVLGRAKLPQDTTQFLVGILVSQVSNKAMAVVDDASLALVWPKLSAQEQNFYNANKLQATDPIVVAFFAEQPPPIPA